jgi:hypothetical protein
MSAPTDTLALLTVWSSPDVPQLDLSQWQELLRQARKTKLLGRLAVRADRLGWMAQLPDGVRLRLVNAAKAVQRKHLDTIWEADRLREALQALPTRRVLLKGAAYVLIELPGSQGREFSDVDILVSHDHLQAVEMALLAHGWVGAQLDPYDDRYYRQKAHELPPMQHVQRLTHLDVHHRLVPLASRYAFDEQPMLDSCRPLPAHPGLAVLAPVDMVLHSVVHLMQEGDFSGALRDLLDLSDMLSEFAGDAGFWATLLSRADRFRLHKPLHDALVLARDMVHAPVPAAPLAELASRAGPRLVRRSALWMMRRAILASLRQRMGWLDGAAAEGLYLRSHWLRMPWHELLPHLLRKAWMRGQARLRRMPAGLPDAAPR